MAGKFLPSAEHKIQIRVFDSQLVCKIGGTANFARETKVDAGRTKSVYYGKEKEGFAY